ncbi:FMN-binding protein [Kitasatospora sp. LaBMicrA B282]|uniref:FMN-binding protein n=1 Tax=Kitasatospora sp. LaBMicrA B282 TaxID=3420949 RepID=UPI003D0D6DCE
MRRTVITTAATAAGVVLLLSAKPHGSASAQSLPVISSDTGNTAAADQGGDQSTAQPTAGGAAGSAGGAGNTGGAGSPSGAASSGTGGSSAGSHTVTGSSIDTRYGPVQVRITLTGGKLTKVDVLQYPADTNRDEEINSYALPQLNQEAIAAGNAQIDAVSGATYTSDGYTRSLQSALDQAGVH